jgi:2-polyprenyl-3-methyl-5-hydroxy-6-metoxy-1,4-benzoquinol methylase
VRKARTHLQLTAGDYERTRSGHLERRRREILRREATAVRQNGHVAEIGCGTGAFLRELAAQRPDLRLVGVDLEPKMIDYAQTQNAAPNLRFECADGRCVGTATEAPFDLAISIDVLHHVDDLQAFIAGVAGSLRDGGRWIVMEPNVHHPVVFLSQERMRRAGLGEDHFRPRRAERLFRAAGLRIAHRTYALFFPGWIERVPEWIAWPEPLLEGFRFLGGTVIYRLERQDGG